MPMAELNIGPSVNIESTDADNPSRISECQFIRWRGDLPEKRGGSTLYINQRLEGIPVDLQPWGDIDGDPLVGVATTRRVYAYNSLTTTLQDISPQYIDQPSLIPNFTTTQGSSLVDIVDSSVTGLTIYNSVTFNTPVAVGGLVLMGTHRIVNITSPTSFQIDVENLATSSVTAGGVVPSFTTNIGTTLVEVNFPVEYQFGKLISGDRVGFDVPTTVGGITVYGTYTVSTVVNPTQFTIVAEQTATSSATASMNGGNVSLRYWISLGPAGVGSGYGSNAYGQYPYGQGNAPTPISGTTYSAANWYLDNRGATLIASAVGGPIFYWGSTTGQTNLSILDGAPVRNAGAFVAMPLGHIMAWGCSEDINPFQDPLFIRWSDAKNPNNWGLQGDTDAGFYTIPTGSRIVRGIQGQTQQYWFTDVDLYVAQYVGYPTVYSFNKVGNGCGLVAPKSVALLGGSLYWMSNREFFVCPSGGAPQPIPCSVWDFIFQNMDFQYQSRVIAGSNSLFNEVTWFFPSKNSDLAPGTPNAYVTYNAQYNEWDVGYLNRTAWFDQSLVGEPIAADYAGYVYKHETSYNNAVGPDTAAINAWFRTGYFSLTEGQDLAFVDWLLPDMKWGLYNQPELAEVKFTFYVTDYAGQTPRVYGPYTTTKDTPYICPRFRGRFLAIRVESTDLNSFWRLGSIRYRFAQSGRR